MKTFTITFFNFFGATIVLNIWGWDTIIVLIIVFMGLSVIDIITGYFKNKVIDRKSHILGKGIMFRVIKMCFILLLLLLTSHSSFIFEEYQYMIGAIPMIIMLGWIATETKSIVENLQKIGLNDTTFSNVAILIKKIENLFNNAFNEVSDYFIKKITDYVSKSTNKERDSRDQQ